MLRAHHARTHTNARARVHHKHTTGTLHYMAPEVVKNPLKDHPDDFKNESRYHYNVVVDSWAVGCLAYELLVGYPPFSANTQQQVGVGAVTWGPPSVLQSE
jgi:serine/threonine protein kinase